MLKASGLSFPIRRATGTDTNTSPGIGVTAAVALFAAAESVAAGELLDRVIDQGRAESFSPVRANERPNGTTELDPLTVYGHRDPFLDSDFRLTILGEALPCLGCGGKRQGLPFALQFSKGLALWAVGAFFQHPRVRGEPNDEAAYYALRAAMCIDDSPGCLDRHPNPDMFNWVPDHSADDEVMSEANTVLKGR
jgi:hypothetical protein